MTDLVATSSSKAPDTRTAVVAALSAPDQSTRASAARQLGFPVLLLHSETATVLEGSARSAAL